MSSPAPSPRSTASAGKSGAAAPETRVLSTNDPNASYHRQHARTAITLEVALHELDEFNAVRPALSAQCEDISAGGFGVRTKKLLYAGQLVAMVIPGKGGAPKVLFGRVANVSYLEAGRYHVGFKLAQQPASPALSAWMASLSPAKKSA